MTENFQLFNLATMSGVFPGTRTMVFQRVRLQPLGAPEDRWQWARILWYDDPAACVVELEARSDAAPPPDGGSALEWQALVHISAPPTKDVRTQLRRNLEAAGWQLRCCGTCAVWLPLTAATPDGLPVGRCTWRSAREEEATLAPILGAQSMLALQCPHWLPADTAETSIPAPETVMSTPEAVMVAPMRKRAEEETDERWTFWGRIRRTLGGKGKQQDTLAVRLRTWEQGLVERSGVGAGTESCFACQGRIANLGALAVATPEGDKQTFSVWRCRSCYTFYLNDWVDRWERTDSLETEESYYRLSPREAMEVLAVIDGVVHAEHPARRHERDAQRRWMLDFLAGRPRLSHQVKQGR